MRRIPRPGTLDPDEDARLVERCLAGDSAAWEALVRRHERLVYTVARGYRLSEADLGDVFQEVFAALVQGLPRLRDARALVRWLTSTTERIARASALRDRRERAASTGHPEVMDRLPAPDRPIGVDLEETEEQALLRLALLSLHERCRALLTALYLEDPTPGYTEISRRLGVPMGSLGPTRARCLARLRELYSGSSPPGRIKSVRPDTSAPDPPDSRRSGRRLRGNPARPQRRRTTPAVIRSGR